MTRPAPTPMLTMTLTSILLRSVSHGAQAFSLHPYLFEFQIDQTYEGIVEGCGEYHGSAAGVLARIRLWLRLLWGGREAVFTSAHVRYDAPSNRQFARRRRNQNLPTVRRADALAYHILRRQGLKRCQQWLYNHTLTGRVRWCFKKDNWRFASRRNFADCVIASPLSSACSAPLRPD